MSTLTELMRVHQLWQETKDLLHQTTRKQKLDANEYHNTVSQLQRDLDSKDRIINEERQSYEHHFQKLRDSILLKDQQLADFTKKHDSKVDAQAKHDAQQRANAYQLQLSGFESYFSSLKDSLVLKEEELIKSKSQVLEMKKRLAENSVKINVQAEQIEILLMQKGQRVEKETFRTFNDVQERCFKLEDDLKVVNGQKVALELVVKVLKDDITSKQQEAMSKVSLIEKCNLENSVLMTKTSEMEQERIREKQVFERKMSEMMVTINTLQGMGNVENNMAVSSINIRKNDDTKNEGLVRKEIANEYEQQITRMQSKMTLLTAQMSNVTDRCQQLLHENQQLLIDNNSLTNMNNNDDADYKATFADADVTFYRALRRQHSELPLDMIECIRKFALQLNNNGKRPSEKLLTQFLRALNEIWQNRFAERIKELNHKHTDRVRTLKRQLANKKTYTEVLQRAKIQTLHAHLTDIRKKHGPGCKHDSGMLDAALVTVEQLSDDMNKMEEEILVLKAMCQKYKQGNTQKNAQTFEEGVVWMEKKALKHLSTFNQQIIQVSQKFLDAVTTLASRSSYYASNAPSYGSNNSFNASAASSVASSSSLLAANNSALMFKCVSELACQFVDDMIGAEKQCRLSIYGKGKKE